VRGGSGQRPVSPREKTKKRKPTAKKIVEACATRSMKGRVNPPLLCPLREKRPSRKVAATEALQKQNLLGLAEGL
jgi:hypothetical protein